MVKRKSGFAFHVHHDVLFEYCTDYEERVNYIKANKSADEVDLRLRLFKLIPTKRLPSILKEAEEAFNEAGKAYDEAEEAFYEAEEAFYEAWEAFDEAWEAYETQIIQLHKELCPDCPWDGKTIFPRS